MEEKLFSATRKKLEKNGILANLRSDFEHEILNLLGLNNGIKRNQKLLVTNKTRAADELVADYLDWIGYTFTCAIFNSESCIGSEGSSPRRAKLINELELEEFADDNLPLLCSLISKVHNNQTDE